MSVPKYEQEYYQYQAHKIELEPHFLSLEYIKDYNETRNERGIIDEQNINKKYNDKDYELIYQLGAKQNTYPSEELRETIDMYSTFLIKNAIKHYVASHPSALVLRDLLPIDMVFEGDLGPEVFYHNYMRQKPWCQKYVDIDVRGNSKALFTHTSYKEILLFGFRNLDPEMHHTTAGLGNISIALPLMMLAPVLTRRIEYIVEDYYGDLYIGEKDRVDKIPQYKLEQLRDMYRSSNANQSEMSSDQFLENINKYVTYIQRGNIAEMTFGLIKDQEKISPIIYDNRAKYKDKDYQETFIKPVGLVVEALGVSVAG